MVMFGKAMVANARAQIQMSEALQASANNVRKTECSHVGASANIHAYRAEGLHCSLLASTRWTQQIWHGELGSQTLGQEKSLGMFVTVTNI